MVAAVTVLSSGGAGNLELYTGEKNSVPQMQVVSVQKVARAKGSLVAWLV